MHFYSREELFLDHYVVIFVIFCFMVLCFSIFLQFQVHTLGKQQGYLEHRKTPSNIVYCAESIVLRVFGV
jgi:hypothetical protein